MWEAPPEGTAYTSVGRTTSAMVTETIRLIAIVKQHGLEYVQTHFRYTLLEHYDFTVPKDVVLARESYWKEALDTRKHGYNGN